MFSFIQNLWTRVAIKSTETLAILQIIHTKEGYTSIGTTLIFQLASVAALVFCGGVFVTEH